MSNLESKGQTLYVFNLVTDLESPILAAAHEWVVALSMNFEFVKVYSTHVGKVELPANVHLTELGGGGLLGKVNNLLGLAKALASIFRERKKSSVFHHMSSRSLAILGFPIKCLNVPQGIWYSHSHADYSLRIGKIFVDFIFTSTPNSIPLKSKKVIYVGHGISVPGAEFRIPNDIYREGIVSLGRVARIKKLESLILAVGEFNLSANLPIAITFIGPISDLEYKQELINLAENQSVSISFFGSVKYTEVLKTLSAFSYIYSGTPNSVDKALLEGSLAGCLVLSVNHDAQLLSGMSEIMSMNSKSDEPSIVEQLQLLESLPPEKRDPMRKKLSETCERNNNLNQTTAKIAATLKKPRSSRNAR
jgi:hypothetical protein